MLKALEKKTSVSSKLSDIFRPSSAPSRFATSELYQKEVMADSPVLYLRFNETSGTTCADCGPNGLTGTAQAGAVRNVASAFSSLGVGITISSSYVSVADNALLDITGAFTFECWLKPGGFTGDPFLFSKGQDDGSHAGYSMWISSSSSKLRFAQGNIGSFSVQSTGTISTGVWTHVAVTRDGSGVITYYINGSASGTGTDTTAVQATSQAFTVGGILTAGAISGEFVSLSVDEVAVFGAALSSGRIAAHYAAAV